LLFGIPSMNVPQIFPVQPMAAAIPEIPFAKRRDQRGIAKIAVFAYHRETGTPVWQSGLAHQESSANDVWILGAGPFQRGTIYEGTEFAGKVLNNDHKATADSPGRKPAVDLARERIFNRPEQLAKAAQPPPVAEQAVVPAVHQEAAALEVPAAPAPIMADAAQPIPRPASPGAPAQALNRGLPAAKSTENEELRKLLTARGYAAPDQSAISARMYEAQQTRQTGMLDPKTAFPRLVDPVPLPQPRFNSP
jgi:hypothetical protein